MGASVRAAAPLPPARFVDHSCPTCGQTTVTWNGAYLRWLRESAGLDQRTLARRLKTSGAYLSDIERNRRALPERIRRAYLALHR